jgi:hypothetical protein
MSMSRSCSLIVAQVNSSGYQADATARSSSTLISEATYENAVAILMAVSIILGVAVLCFLVRIYAERVRYRRSVERDR